MEQFLYEKKPYIMILLGILGLKSGTTENLSVISLNTIGPISGIIILFCAAIILYDRHNYRSQNR